MTYKLAFNESALKEWKNILQYTLAFQRVKINSINVVVIFTLLAI